MGNVVVRERACVDCGAAFALREKEIAFFVRRALLLPKRCKACRQVRRLARLEADGRTGRGHGGLRADRWTGAWEPLWDAIVSDDLRLDRRGEESNAGRRRGWRARP